MGESGGVPLVRQNADYTADGGAKGNIWLRAEDLLGTIFSATVGPGGNTQWAKHISVIAIPETATKFIWKTCRGDNVFEGVNGNDPAKPNDARILCVGFDTDGTTGLNATDTYEWRDCASGTHGASSFTGFNHTLFVDPPGTVYSGTRASDSVDLEYICIRSVDYPDGVWVANSTLAAGDLLALSAVTAPFAGDDTLSGYCTDDTTCNFDSINLPVETASGVLPAIKRKFVYDSAGTIGQKFRYCQGTGTKAGVGDVIMADMLGFTLTTNAYSPLYTATTTALTIGSTDWWCTHNTGEWRSDLSGYQETLDQYGFNLYTIEPE